MPYSEDLINIAKLMNPIFVEWLTGFEDVVKAREHLSISNHFHCFSLFFIGGEEFLKQDFGISIIIYANRTIKIFDTV